MNPELAGFEAERTPKSPLARGWFSAVLLYLDRVMNGAAADQAGKNANKRDRHDVRDEREKQFGVVDNLEGVCIEMAKEFHISGIEAVKIPGYYYSGRGHEKDLRNVLYRIVAMV